MSRIFLCSQQYFNGKVKEIGETAPSILEPSKVIRTAPMPFGDSIYTEGPTYIKHLGDYYLVIKGIEPENGYVSISKELLLGILESQDLTKEAL